MFATLLAAATLESQYVVIVLCTFQVLLTVFLLLLTFPRRGGRK